jgi:PKHD-type hydroxylase
MDFQILHILERNEIQQIVSHLAGQTWADGKLTAHGLARSVKNNLQMERAGPEQTEADRVLLAALARNEFFQTFAIPKRIASPTFSRYEVGMEYGDHVDGAIMGSGGGAIRTDLACTVFLSDPGSYDGGELILEMSFGEQEIKLEAGEAIVYSATTMHRVAPVTKGMRLVALTWIQSAVPDERLRAILFDLSAAIKHAGANTDHRLLTNLNKSYHNLLRYAVDL